ncbi:MAG: exbB 1 [Firmicutes bacterium]|nr:exbB 1 [Bacillota bacterium]
MDSIEDGFHLFRAGGPIMYFILLCSFIVLSIGIERYMYYKNIKANNEKFMAELKPLIEDCKWESASELCRENGGIVAGVASRGISCFTQKVVNIESVLEGEASLTVAKLRANLNHLDTIVTIAPLLGLLGTVIGMIGSFSVMNVKNGQPLAITGGVGEALVATASGLCVAVLSMLFYSYFNHRLDHVITEIEEVCILLVSQIKQEKAS